MTLATLVSRLVAEENGLEAQWAGGSGEDFAARPGLVAAPLLADLQGNPKHWRRSLSRGRALGAVDCLLGMVRELVSHGAPAASPNMRQTLGSAGATAAASAAPAANDTELARTLLTRVERGLSQNTRARSGVVLPLGHAVLYAFWKLSTTPVPPIAAAIAAEAQQSSTYGALRRRGGWVTGDDQLHLARPSARVQGRRGSGAPPPGILQAISGVDLIQAIPWHLSFSDPGPLLRMLFGPRLAERYAGGSRPWLRPGGGLSAVAGALGSRAPAAPEVPASGALLLDSFATLRTEAALFAQGVREVQQSPEYRGRVVDAYYQWLAGRSALDQAGGGGGPAAGPARENVEAWLRSLRHHCTAPRRLDHGSSPKLRSGRAADGAVGGGGRAAYETRLHQLVRRLGVVSTVRSGPPEALRSLVLQRTRLAEHAPLFLNFAIRLVSATLRRDRGLYQAHAKRSLAPGSAAGPETAGGAAPPPSQLAAPALLRSCGTLLLQCLEARSLAVVGAALGALPTVLDLLTSDVGAAYCMELFGAVTALVLRTARSAEHVRRTAALQALWSTDQLAQGQPAKPTQLLELLWSGDLVQGTAPEARQLLRSGVQLLVRLLRTSELAESASSAGSQAEPKPTRAERSAGGRRSEGGPGALADQLARVAEAVVPLLAVPRDHAWAFAYIRGLLKRRSGAEARLDQVLALVAQLCGALVVQHQDTALQAQARAFLVEYLLEAPLGRARFHDHLVFLCNNLKYTHARGRISVLQTLDALVRGMATEVFNDEGDYLFFAVAAQLSQQSRLTGEADEPGSGRAPGPRGPAADKSAGTPQQVSWRQRLCALVRLVFRRGTPVMRHRWSKAALAWLDTELPFPSALAGPEAPSGTAALAYLATAPVQRALSLRRVGTELLMEVVRSLELTEDPSLDALALRVMTVVCGRLTRAPAVVVLGTWRLFAPGQPGPPQLVQALQAGGAASKAAPSPPAETRETTAGAALALVDLWQHFGQACRTAGLGPAGASRPPRADCARVESTRRVADRALVLARTWRVHQLLHPDLAEVTGSSLALLALLLGSCRARVLHHPGLRPAVSAVLAVHGLVGSQHVWIRSVKVVDRLLGSEPVPAWCREPGGGAHLLERGLQYLRAMSRAPWPLRPLAVPRRALGIGTDADSMVLLVSSRDPRVSRAVVLAAADPVVAPPSPVLPLRDHEAATWGAWVAGALWGASDLEQLDRLVRLAMAGAGHPSVRAMAARVCLWLALTLPAEAFLDPRLRVRASQGASPADGRGQLPGVGEDPQTQRAGAAAVLLDTGLCLQSSFSGKRAASSVRALTAAFHQLGIHAVGDATADRVPELLGQLLNGHGMSALPPGAQRARGHLERAVASAPLGFPGLYRLFLQALEVPATVFEQRCPPDGTRLDSPADPAALKDVQSSRELLLAVLGRAMEEAVGRRCGARLPAARPDARELPRNPILAALYAAAQARARARKAAGASWRAGRPGSSAVARAEPATAAPGSAVLAAAGQAQSARRRRERRGRLQTVGEALRQRRSVRALMAREDPVAVDLRHIRGGTRLSERQPGAAQRRSADQARDPPGDAAAPGQGQGDQGLVPLSRSAWRRMRRARRV